MSPGFSLAIRTLIGSLITTPANKQIKKQRLSGKWQHNNAGWEKTAFKLVTRRPFKDAAVFARCTQGGEGGKETAIQMNNSANSSSWLSSPRFLASLKRSLPTPWRQRLWEPLTICLLPNLTRQQEIATGSADKEDSSGERNWLSKSFGCFCAS